MITKGDYKNALHDALYRLECFKCPYHKGCEAFENSRSLTDDCLNHFVKQSKQRHKSFGRNK